MGFISLLSQGTGAFFYHLLVLLALESSLALAYALNKHGRDLRFTLISRALTGVFALRLLLLLGSASTLLRVPSALILPPLERFVELTTLILLVWAFFSAAVQPSLRRALLLAGVTLSLLLGAYSFVQWYGHPDLGLGYNHTPEALVWAGWNTLIAVMGLWLAVLTTGANALLGGVFLVLALGSAAQMLLPVPVPHTPLWNRWANVVAYPLLAAYLYGLLLSVLTREEHVEEIEGMPLPEARALLRYFTVTSRNAALLDPASVQENYLVGLARALQAERCFIALLDEETPDALNLMIAENGKTIKRIDKLPLGERPFLAEVLNLKSQIIIQDPSAVRKWASVLGETPKTLVLQPVLSREEIVGFIGLCSSTSEPPAPWQRRVLGTIANQLRLALEKARLYQALERKVEALAWQLHSKDKALSRYKAILEEHKSRRKEDAELVQDRITFLEQRVKELEEEKSILEKELEKTRKQAKKLESRTKAQKAEIKNLKDQLRSLVEREGPASETTIESIPCGVILCDAEGKILQANKQVERILGWPAREFVGQNLSSFTDDPEWKRALDSLLEEGAEEATAVVEIASRIVKARFARSEKGIAVAILDLTEEIQGQRNKDLFLASLATDVRNPMTAIMGYTDLLLSESVGLVGDMQRRFLLRIKSNIERLNKLLNDLLNVAAVDSGQLRLQITNVNPTELVDEALLTVRAQMESARVQVEVDIQENIPPAELDFERCKYILTTLLSNAIACSPPESIIRLEVRTEPPEGEPEFLRISVTDAGGGIPKDELDRVFTRFYRADQALIRGLGEKGVGLALVKTLVDLHGGRVWAESEMGAGTTFVVLLPLRHYRLLGSSLEKGEEENA